MASLRSRHGDGIAGSEGKGKLAGGAAAMDSNVVSLQINMQVPCNESDGSDRPPSEPNLRLYPYSQYGCAYDLVNQF